MPTAKYQLDNANIASIRLSTDILALAGAQPAGAQSSPLFVQARGSTRRRTGIRARSVTYSVNIGTAVAPSFKRITIPFLTPAAFAAAPATVTYRAVTYARTSQRGEDY